MKNIENLIVLTVLVFTLSIVKVNAQNIEMQKDDGLIRSVMAFDESQYNLMFEATSSQAYANLMIKAFNNMLPLPEFDFSKLPLADMQKLETLKAGLIQLRTNPPSWETIVKSEEAKIKTEAAPPTAPVFAGSKEAEEYYQTVKDKSGIRHNPSSISNYSEIKQDQNVLNQKVIEEKKQESDPH